MRIPDVDQVGHTAKSVSRAARDQTKLNKNLRGPIDEKVRNAAGVAGLHRQGQGRPHQGIPYQTLVSSVLHKYIDGRLIEKGS